MLTLYPRKSSSLTERYICAKLLSRGLLELENRSIASIITVVVRAVQHIAIYHTMYTGQQFFIIIIIIIISSIFVMRHKVVTSEAVGCVC